MSVSFYDSSKKDIIEFFNDGNELGDNRDDFKKKTRDMKEVVSCEAIEDDNNNFSIYSPPVSNKSSNMETMQAVEDIISVIFNMVVSDDIEEPTVVKDDQCSAMDASKVPFACQDIRTKPGYIQPVQVKKPKVVVKEKKFIDTFNHHIVLALPGESVFIPDISEETWKDASDEELGKELADKLQEEKKDMMVSLIKSMGRNVVLDYFWKTQNVEEKGGLLIMNGSRRRTSGGVLFQLLRVSKNDEVKEKFDLFLKEKQSVSNRKPEEKTIEQRKQFDKQIEDFVKEQKVCKKNESRSEESDKDDDMNGHVDVECKAEDETTLY